MKTCAIAVACCLAMTAMLAYAQTADEGYQMARVVSFEKLAANEQHPEYADRYKIAMQLGDTIYICQARGSAATFLDWAPNKEFPAKVDNKTLLVKNFNGQVLEMTILKKKTPK